MSGTTIKGMEERIKERAQTETQAAIGLFMTEVNKAAVKLYCTQPTWLSDKERDALLAVAVKPYSERKWPSKLWTIREERLRNEILSQFDGMQKLLKVDETIENPEQMEAAV